MNEKETKLCIRLYEVAVIGGRDARTAIKESTCIKGGCAFWVFDSEFGWRCGLIK